MRSHQLVSARIYQFDDEGKEKICNKGKLKQSARQFQSICRTAIARQVITSRGSQTVIPFVILLHTDCDDAPPANELRDTPNTILPDQNFQACSLQSPRHLPT